MGGRYHASIARSGVKIGKPSECFRLPLGSKAVRLRPSKRFPLCTRKRTSPILELLLPPASRACRHRGLARWRITACRCAIFVLPEGEVDRAAAVLHDARATTAVGASYSGVNRSSTCKLNQTKYAPNASPIATL